MKQQLYYTNFAQAYGEGSYSSCTYNNTESCTTSSGSTGSGSGSNGGLANTGFDMLLIVTVACALIFAGLLIRIMRKKKVTKKAQDGSQVVPTDVTVPGAPSAYAAPTAQTPPNVPQPPTATPPQPAPGDDQSQQPGGPTNQNIPPRQI